MFFQNGRLRRTKGGDETKKIRKHLIKAREFKTDRLGVKSYKRRDGSLICGDEDKELMKGMREGKINK